jgi:hypothetical protein
MSKLNYTNQPRDDFRGKTIAFCLPGAMYSGTFMTQMIRLVFDLNQLGINFYISQHYSSMVNFARTDCLQADNFAGTMLTPWRGQIPYDYIMWIDSDIIFKTEDLLELLKMDKDIATGWYVQSNGTPISNQSTVVEKMDKQLLLNKGAYHFETVEEMARRPGPFKVDYCGFGWVLMKKGVFEKIPYPWFAPKKVQLIKEDGTILEDMCSEDVAMCEDFKEYGFEIWCNPKVRVGHQKMVIL